MTHNKKHLINIEDEYFTLSEDNTIVFTIDELGAFIRYLKVVANENN